MFKPTYGRPGRKVARGHSPRGGAGDFPEARAEAPRYLGKLSPVRWCFRVGVGFFLAAGLLVSVRAETLFVANFDDGNINKISPAGRTSVYATGLVHPQNLAYGPDGSFYVSSTDGSNTGTIVRIYSTTKTETFYSGTGIKFPAGLAFDPAGLLHAADALDGKSIFKFTADGSSFAPVVSGLKNAHALAFDPNGKMYISDFNDGAILTLGSAGIADTLVKIPGQPAALAFNSHGDLFADKGGGRDRAGGEVGRRPLFCQVSRAQPGQCHCGGRAG